MKRYDIKFCLNLNIFMVGVDVGCWIIICETAVVLLLTKGRVIFQLLFPQNPVDGHPRILRLRFRIQTEQIHGPYIVRM